MLPVAKCTEPNRAKKGGGEIDVIPTLYSPLPSSSSTVKTLHPSRPQVSKPKKDVKSLLKGVVVKKKPKPKSDSTTSTSNGGKIGPTAAEVSATNKVGAAGMTALGKRLVQEDSPTEEEGDKRARVE